MRMRSGWLTWVGAVGSAAGLACGSMARAQQDPAVQVPAVQAPTAQQATAGGDEAGVPTLKVTAQNVVLDVVVTDRNGHNVKGLTKDDFTVYEDKEGQTIRSFEEVSPKPGPVVAVNSTAELDKVEPDAPVSILVIDELTSRFEDLSFTRYSIKKYLGGQGDTLAQPTMLVAVNFKDIAVICDYTTSRKAILEALSHHLADYGQLIGRGAAVGIEFNRLNATLGSLIGVAEAAQGHEGHKNIIWVGRGFPPINNQAIPPDAVKETTDRLAMTTRLLRDARVTLYSIDPAGVLQHAPVYHGSSSGEEGPFVGHLNFETIAIATGGQALHGNNDVDNLIDRSVRDGQYFYTLAYKPTSESQDPKEFRRIKVVMKDSSLKASGREGYFVGAAPVAPVQYANGRYSQRVLMDLGVAAGNILEYDGVPLTVAREEAAPDTFDLRLKASGLPVTTDADQKQSAELTVVALAFDRKGKQLARSAQVMTVGIGSAPANGADMRTLRLPVTIATAEPAARLRFVVRANGDGKLGAANFFLVDRKTLADPAMGTDRKNNYK